MNPNNLETPPPSLELPRKTIHLLSLLVPVISYYHLGVAQALLIFLILFYGYSEWQKIKGGTFFAHNFIHALQRHEEKTGFAKAPIFLAIGSLIAISCYSWQAALIAIYQAGFCDTTAAWSGKKWGKAKWPLSTRKTYIGSLAFFLTALPLTLMYLPASKAITLCLVGAFLESLPFKDWDNILVPVIIGFLADQFF